MRGAGLHRGQGSPFPTRVHRTTSVTCAVPCKLQLVPTVHIPVIDSLSTCSRSVAAPTVRTQALEDRDSDTPNQTSEMGQFSSLVGCQRARFTRWPSPATALSLFMLMLPSSALATTFHDGDYIHAARKAQFHGVWPGLTTLGHPALCDSDGTEPHIYLGFPAQMRTNWQDLLGQHGPRFGVDRLVGCHAPRTGPDHLSPLPARPTVGCHCPQVAVPITKPALPWKAEDTYKIQFSFDGEGRSACAGEPWGRNKEYHPAHGGMGPPVCPLPGHCWALTPLAPIHAFYLKGKCPASAAACRRPAPDALAAGAGRGRSRRAADRHHADAVGGGGAGGQRRGG